jgi:hypothetical protein
MKDRDSIETTHETGPVQHPRGHSKRREHGTSRRSSDALSGGPHVIARIPRVQRSHVEAITPEPEATDGDRLFRPWLSARLLVGSVVIIVVVAIATCIHGALGRKSATPSDLASQDAAIRPEVPAPNAPEAPPSPWEKSPPSERLARRATPASLAVPRTEYSQSTSYDARPNPWAKVDQIDGPSVASLPPAGGRIASPNPATAPTELPILGAGSTWNDQPRPAAPQLPANRPWDAPRGGGPAERPAEGLPPDSMAAPYEAAPGYRPPSRGGLVNLDAAGYRDSAGNEPANGYRTAARPNYSAGVRAPAGGTWPADYSGPASQAAYQRPALSPPPVDRYPAPSTEYRNDVPPSSYPAITYPSTDGSIGGASAPQGTSESYPPAGDPGAARFEGGIQRPTGRTINEYAR